jgi:hypothetical protein
MRAARERGLTVSPKNWQSYPIYSTGGNPQFGRGFPETIHLVLTLYALLALVFRL